MFARVWRVGLGSNQPLAAKEEMQRALSEGLCGFAAASIGAWLVLSRVLSNNAVLCYAYAVCALGMPGRTHAFCCPSTECRAWSGEGCWRDVEGGVCLSALSFSSCRLLSASLCCALSCRLLLPVQAVGSSVCSVQQTWSCFPECQGVVPHDAAQSASALQHHCAASATVVHMMAFPDRQ